LSQLTPSEHILGEDDEEAGLDLRKPLLSPLRPLLFPGETKLPDHQDFAFNFAGHAHGAARQNCRAFLMCKV
jgi:hypothetical protein